MLSCRNLTVRPKPNAPALVHGATAHFAAGGLHALIGPSGCGKTTLLKGILDILPSEGEVLLHGHPLASREELLRDVAFAPQFSIAHGKLTVAEAVGYALKLYQKTDEATLAARNDELLQLVGLQERGATLVEKLSGGQLRRLGLALELTTDPRCLLCDEVTSGLDPRSEDQIIAVLRALVEQRGKTVVCVIHNLAKLSQFDTVTVVFEGVVVWQGPLAAMLEHFGISDALELYDRLSEQTQEEWRDRWAAVVAAQGESHAGSVSPAPLPAGSRRVSARPSVGSQLVTLLARRWRLLVRDRGYLLLTMAITFGFPCLVVIFALGGLPQMKGLALETTGGFLEMLQAKASHRQAAAETATLVSGLIIFQVILLCLMGSNNGAREIAAERTLYEKERMSGLRPVAYAWSKLLYTALLGAAQGAWMTVFVKLLCEFPGGWGAQLAVLSVTGASMSVVCLGLSAMLSSPDKASLLSIYLVGFQLPLSGVVLALPAALVWAVRPFIATYWGWAGYLTAMTDSSFYDAVGTLDKGWLSPPLVAVGVLGAHLLTGAALVFWGCQRKCWP
ncbi:ABC transporter ATP-binding protein/permease [Rariglobus hedericola]|uniref:ABC transporter ATP-binding protein/permease n=1 Tax=Rariglobus hedericola TaxID=2597822 RepID=A0A556QQN0_9BACT|nr:ABC transporter ATP-binding protein/permease [Rariglobus hedericola]TSJ78933.1 ABC transporter ATP-binding protein/permease [Rariglobus hedericola]